VDKVAVWVLDAGRVFFLLLAARLLGLWLLGGGDEHVVVSFAIDVVD
jgi:hypothetical protein